MGGHLTPPRHTRDTITTTSPPRHHVPGRPATVDGQQSTVNGQSFTNGTRAPGTGRGSLRLTPEQFLLLYRELGADDYRTASRQVSEEEDTTVSCDQPKLGIKRNEKF
ncbi:unnamed protein product, partial [Iphiclides podalirius]